MRPLEANDRNDCAAERPAADVSPALVAFVARWEGCRLTAYQDGGGVWTIGYGHTRGVQEGDHVTQEEADRLFLRDLVDHARGVDALVKVRLSDDQRNALVSFAFNLGLHALAGSTLLHLLNLRDYAGAAREFKRWCHIGTREDAGLLRRRMAERDLFLSLEPTP